MNKKISIACDHGGLELKDGLVRELSKQGFEVNDKGVFNHDSVDYPDYAQAVCKDVSSKASDFGILVCTTGVGMSIAANKMKGIRAALVLNEDSAKFSRLHNNANVICFGQKYVSVEDGVKYVNLFANTEFEGGRHERRVSKFMNFENL